MKQEIRSGGEYARNRREIVYYMHIEKNAGTTTRNILCMNYAPSEYLGAPVLARASRAGGAKTIDSIDVDVFELVSEIQNRQASLACVAAGLPSGVDKYLDQPVVYFTFLRDPVERCISYWYFAYQNRARSPLWSILESYDFDLGHILASPVGFPFCNDQVRMVAGIGTASVAASDVSVAREIIEERFFLTGTLAAYRPCLDLLAKRFGWLVPSFDWLNVGEKTDRSLLPTRAEQWFRAANELDIRLYDWVVREYLPRRLS
jgi:hypothetical protein